MTEPPRNLDPVSSPEPMSPEPVSPERRPSSPESAQPQLGGGDSSIRRGSPFARSASRGDAVAPLDSHATGSDVMAWRQADVAFDPEWGVLRAANWASAWVALCGVACLFLFPGGGVIVAALGCALATIGLFSSRPIVATGLLLIHAGLFFACYQRLF